MQDDPAHEWQRLTNLYGEKSDEELLDLAEDFGNLTETAQQVLRDEMKKRRLKAPGTAPVADNRPVFGRWSEGIAGKESVRSAGNSEDDQSGDDVPRVYLCECEDSEQVNQLGEALRRAGIESWVENLHAPFAERGLETCRIFVRADQLPLARDVASRPIPQEIIDDLKKPVDDFKPPACPKCGGADPLLESVDPSNSWRCENCGAQWSEAVENPAAKGAP